jgi:hypothetical protein
MFDAAEVLLARTERAPRLVAPKPERDALTNRMSQMAQGLLHWYNFVGTC